ncbi:hypothetical protein [Antarctobacter jejuensis]|uniref:hypothetical protein n=1 Tax=Antarctobacter jejuensis TaxID=1439938 RepID=UPI003FD5D4A5
MTAGSGSRGKSAQSVGHQAKGLVAARCWGTHDCRSQGATASGIARGIETGQGAVEALYVNVSYTVVATSLTMAAGESGAAEVAPVASGSDPETTEIAVSPEVAPTVVPTDEVADGPEDVPEEGGNTGYVSGGAASAYYLQAQVSYMSASIALELLR